jgi:hypothetical protein
MDQDMIALIAAALAAGAAAGVRGTASAVITDAYAALKGLARRCLADRPNGELVLTEHENDPQTWQAPLRAELARAGAGEDQELIAAARTLVSLLETAGHRDAITAIGSNSVAVGHNEGIISTAPDARNYLRRSSPGEAS